MHFTTAQALKQQELRNQEKLAKQKEIAEAVDERFEKEDLGEILGFGDKTEPDVKELEKLASVIVKNRNGFIKFTDNLTRAESLYKKILKSFGNSPNAFDTIENKRYIKARQLISQSRSLFHNQVKAWNDEDKRAAK